MNQELPGTAPELFAPDIINTDSVELNGVFNNDFNEFFFSRLINGSFIIHHCYLKDSIWTAPQPIQMFSDTTVRTLAVDMTLTKDGQTMYFLGSYLNGSPIDQNLDIYCSKKVNGKWTLATQMPKPINTDFDEYYPVIVNDGSMYFVSNRETGNATGEVFRAQYLNDGTFAVPVKLDQVINTGLGAGDTYVSPDESYLIYNTKSVEGLSGLYISFNVKGKRQKAVYLGEPINSEWTDFCPYVTPDGKYFFFSRRYSDPIFSGWSGAIDGKVFWVSAEILLDNVIQP